MIVVNIIWGRYELNKRWNYKFRFYEHVPMFIISKCTSFYEKQGDLTYFNVVFSGPGYLLYTLFVDKFNWIEPDLYKCRIPANMRLLHLQFDSTCNKWICWMQRRCYLQWILDFFCIRFNPRSTYGSLNKYAHDLIKLILALHGPLLW